MSLFALGLCALCVVADETTDPFIWLEDVTGEKALAWVEAQNEESLAALQARPEFEGSKQHILEILNSDQRLAMPSYFGGQVYNFWRDGNHQRGLVRRTSLESYKTDHPDWEIVLDLDALAKAENENWVFKGYTVLKPDCDRVLMRLSRGGADATVVREFDLKTKAFVKDGFALPEAKSRTDWMDRDHLLVGTDYGDGSLTDSGYPRVIKLWQRGTSLADAKTIFEGQKTDVGVWITTDREYENKWDLLTRAMTFYTSEHFLIQDGKLVKLDLPEDIQLHSVFKGQLVVELKSDWLSYKQGAVIAVDFKKFLAGDRSFQTLFEPNPKGSIGSISRTKNMLVVVASNNVASEVFQVRFEAGTWQKEKLDWPQPGTINMVDHIEGTDQYFVLFTGYLTPNSLVMIDGESKQMQTIKSEPAFFDSEPYVVKQWNATAPDGVSIPYFAIMRKGVSLDGNNPTLLYGYGGFEVSLLPRYSGTLGQAWLERGGVYVVANIRGGGEFGPQWHQAALKKNRHIAFNDFISVAEDLIKRKVTSADKLGIRGGSNGGLLVGTCFTMRPDLFKAVVCQVPLLDMQRYSKLLAGASWMGEYGDPDDPDMWSYIRTYSPYHNLKSEVSYPKVFFTTSTRDDRVHPAHARKMVAKMKQLGHSVYYYENTEGGHAGAANNEQRAMAEALIYSYLAEQLMNPTASDM
ncbi:MAG: S9 family peptidase [Acidobacteria bacterium]|nr:S9 family peptidase [Acidobacteriota bacterium]